jgi:hypothetical protein
MSSSMYDPYLRSSKESERTVQPRSTDGCFLRLQVVPEVRLPSSGGTHDGCCSGAQGSMMPDSFGGADQCDLQCSAILSGKNLLSLGYGYASACGTNGDSVSPYFRGEIVAAIACGDELALRPTWHPSVRSSGCDACFDNSVPESFCSSLTRELVHRYRVASRADAKAAITAWIRRYDNLRAHSACGFVPPIEWTMHYRLTQLETASPCVRLTGGRSVPLHTPKGLVEELLTRLLEASPEIPWGAGNLPRK